MSQRIQALTARKAKLINEAQADIAVAIAKANEDVAKINTRLQEKTDALDDKIAALKLGAEWLRSNKLTVLEQEADAIAAEDASAALLAAQLAEIEFATKVLADRKRMNANGESIALPQDDTPAGMIALLAQEEAAALAAKGL